MRSPVGVKGFFCFFVAQGFSPAESSLSPPGSEHYCLFLTTIRNHVGMEPECSATEAVECRTTLTGTHVRIASSQGLLRDSMAMATRAPIRVAGKS